MTTESNKASEAEATEQLPDLHVPLSSIIADTKKNVRHEMPDVQGLAENIHAVGLLQPLVVRKHRDAEGNVVEGKYDLINGFRRYFALKQNKARYAPIHMLDDDDKKDLARRISENLQRADMTALEKAQGIQRMVEDGSDQKTVAKVLGVTEGFISQHLALLKLPKQVQNAVQHGKIGLTECRELYRLRDHEEKLLELLPEAAKVSVTQLKQTVDVFLEKERLKAEKAAEKEAAKTTKKSGARKTASDEDEEETPKKRSKPSLAEQYADAALEPLGKTALREKLQAYALKLERTGSEDKRLEYKYVLKGMEIAAGLTEG